MKKFLAISAAVAALSAGTLLLKPTSSGAQTNAPLTRESVTQDKVAPTISPVGQDITVVVFQDYQCPVCKRVHPDLEKLIAQDKKIRVVYRDWPVFGGASIEAAKLAIASNYQGKHAAFNDALMRTPGRLSSETIKAAAKKAGVDWARLETDLLKHKTDIDNLIARNNEMAPLIGLEGTPSFIIGTYLIPGGMDLAGLKDSVAMARANPVPEEAQEEALPITNGL